MARRMRNQFYIPEDPQRKPSWLWVIVLFMCGGFTGPVGPVIAAYLAYKRIKADNKCKRYSEFRRLANMIGDRGAVSLRELTSRLGMSLEDVTNALQEMIDEGYIPSGAFIDHSTMMLHLGDDIVETSFVDEAPAQPAARPAQAQQAPEVKAQKAQEKTPARPTPVPRKSPADSEEFEAKLREIRQLNEEIEDGPVSERIDRIGELTASIFRVVREKPEHAEEVRRFMNYYLPTTFKLLKSYSLMEKQSYQGENIQASRKKIEDVLDTLIHAFEQQQDRLFRSEALDVETDISVLETMMASDGLLEKNNDLRLRATGGSGR